ncbi:MAG: protein phosphatase 2C domain-containing protein [Oscillospiraceae bacterium]|nr:protein phosphatase 2C domain-containing protein [Oscillospiraceae bacterium]
MYYCCGISDKGAVREHNEDAYLVNKIVLSKAQMESDVNAPFIAAVADGVGGEASGEIASRMALELLASVRFGKKVDIRAKLLSIHSRLRRYGITHGNSANMQTTLCALAVDEDGRAFVVNVGDSRMYRCRGGVIRQLSTDQSLVQLLYEQGKITGEEKKTHAQRNVIFPVLGNIADDPDPQVTEIDGGIKKGDIIIICSDGLSDYITSGEFEEILAMPMRLPKRLRRLIDTAIDNGSTDNITVVGVSVI